MMAGVELSTRGRQDKGIKKQTVGRLAQLARIAVW